MGKRKVARGIKRKMRKGKSTLTRRMIKISMIMMMSIMMINMMVANLVKNIIVKTNQIVEFKALSILIQSS